MPDLDMTATYQCKGFNGIAVRIAGYPQVWSADTVTCVDDDGNEWEEECGGEMVDDTDSGDVMIIMVGDDKKHRVSIDDLTEINEEDYCFECGQIGCGHGK